ncbi:MAG TPA: hypothetical protein VF519_02890 [Mycobacteriales bacterium]|jgi:hypothetical protein
MRRTLAVLFTAAAVAAVATPAAQASHSCAEGFEILCTNVCLEKFHICLH